MGYDKKYTKQLKTWKEQWWKFDRHGSPVKQEPRKPWWELQYYLERPAEAATRRKWEKQKRKSNA